MRKIDHKIAYLLMVVVFLAASSAFAAKYISNLRNNTSGVSTETNVEVPIVIETEEPPVEEQEAKKEVVKDPPPKRTAKQSVSTATQSDGGQITTVSNGGLSASQSGDYLANCQTSSTPGTARVIDNTGRYSSIGSVLTSYLSELRWGNDINSFCGIFIEDAGETGWSGQYVATYRTSGGRIVSAQGAIVLNASYYRNYSLNIFNEYMKLILSHEYGHHYTQYHKWVDLNLPINVRFPDSYYSVRPLSKSNTSVDCTNWYVCDSEIIAEDYSYLYSGYGLHQMQNIYGYPSTGTKTWLDNLAQASGSSTPIEEPAAPTEPEEEVTPSDTQGETTPTEEATLTIISPISPYTWTSATTELVIQIRSNTVASINKIKLYINDNYVQQINAANVDVGWAYSTVPAGSYIFKAEGHSTDGSTLTATLTITKQ